MNDTPCSRLSASSLRLLLPILCSAPPSALVAKWPELHFSCVNFGPRRRTGLARLGLGWTIRHMCHGAMSDWSLKEIRLNCQLSAILWSSNWFPATPNEAHQQQKNNTNKK